MDPKTVQAEAGHETARMTMDLYAKALTDPAVVEWGRKHFRFPWDTVTHVQDEASEKASLGVQGNDEGRLHG